MNVKRGVLLVSLAAAWAFSATVLSAGGTAGTGGALELRSIMRELSSDMEAVVRGVALGDMAAVEQGARRIADHRRPPAEEMRMVMGLLGEEMPAFKAIDTMVHDAAFGVAEAAGAGDVGGVVEGFNTVLSGCVECHERFRPRVVERFYGPSAGR